MPPPTNMTSKRIPVGMAFIFTLFCLLSLVMQTSFYSLPGEKHLLTGQLIGCRVDSYTGECRLDAIRRSAIFGEKGYLATRIGTITDGGDNFVINQHNDLRSLHNDGELIGLAHRVDDR